MFIATEKPIVQLHNVVCMEDKVRFLQLLSLWLMAGPVWSSPFHGAFCKKATLGACCNLPIYPFHAPKTDPLVKMKKREREMMKVRVIV